LKIYSLILVIIIASFTSCKSSQFIYKNGTKKIELVSPHSIKLTEAITSTNARLRLTNIDPNKLTIVGVGVKLTNSSIKENYIDLSIATRAKYYTDKTYYELNVSFKNQGETINHKFKIPLINPIKA